MWDHDRRDSIVAANSCSGTPRDRSFSFSRFSRTRTCWRPEWRGATSPHWCAALMFSLCEMYRRLSLRLSSLSPLMWSTTMPAAGTPKKARATARWIEMPRFTPSSRSRESMRYPPSSLPAEAMIRRMWELQIRPSAQAQYPTVPGILFQSSGLPPSQAHGTRGLYSTPSNVPGQSRGTKTAWPSGQGPRNTSASRSSTVMARDTSGDGRNTYSQWLGDLILWMSLSRPYFRVRTCPSRLTKYPSYPGTGAQPSSADKAGNTRYCRLLMGGLSRTLLSQGREN